ncbi:hypothetical protein [Streptomyces globisporus]|uniref:hypothetical protein n=1 Tax=Streptomyces globisporus TaxID=1908 RepID=UPI000299FF3C|nr:hypothetical protein [Streptomyces globisporus]
MTSANEANQVVMPPPWPTTLTKHIPNTTARAAIYNDAYEPAVRIFDLDLTNNGHPHHQPLDELTHGPSGGSARPLHGPCPSRAADPTAPPW